MTNDDEVRPDPQDLLPAELQASWMVVPRGSGKWLFVQAFLFGAGVALTTASFFSAHRAGWWGFPAAIAIMAVNGLFLRRREKQWLDSLPKTRCPGGESPSMDV